MNHTISPRQDNSVKRRRVLSDLVNTGVQPIESHTRRKSIGFDLVRILSPEKTSQVTQLDTQNPPQMNRKGSSIPTLRNPDRYEKLLNISESLNRKSKVNHSQVVFTPTSVSQTSKQATEKLIAELETLNDEIRLASDDLAAIDNEYSHQNMLYRALKTEMAELHNVLQDNEAKFEYMLAQTTSQVELKQKELDVSLREYRTTRENSYNNTKFELENELRLVAHFDDTENIQCVQNLQVQRSDLQDKLKQQLEHNERRLHETELEYGRKLEEKKKANCQEIARIESKIVEKQKALKAILLELSKAQEVLASRQQSDALLEQQIIEKKKQIENFASTQVGWQAQLTQITSKLRANNHIQSTWEQEVDNARRLYNENKKKNDKYQQTRRTLEHAISRYGSNRRVFVKGRRALENEHELFGLFFDKVVGPETKEFSKEWELHVQECVNGSLAALIFAGTSINCLEQICTSLSYLIPGLGSEESRKSFEVFIQSVRFEGPRLLDLLNRSNELVLNVRDTAVELFSQKMTVTGINDIDMAFRNICLSEKPTLHILSIVGKDTSQEAKVQSSLFLIDLSKSSLVEQRKVFDKHGTNQELNVLLDHVLTQSRCLIVCEIDDMGIDESRDLLHAIHHSAYG